MPLSEQELRCVRLALQYLGTLLGGSWYVDRNLDEEHPSEPTPEVLATNGSDTAAIEVKRLPDPGTQQLIESLLSNERYLTPSCGGYYWLDTPPDLKHRIDDKIRRSLKKEIERVAPTLNVGEPGALRMPRSGLLKCINTKADVHHVSCYHYGPISDLLRPLSERIDGCFILDDGESQHSFTTETGREEFYGVIAEACQGCLDGDAVLVQWYEEWKLTKVRDNTPDEKDGVWVLAASDVLTVEEAARKCVADLLEKAGRKFENRRWAHLHLLVVDWTAILLDPILDIVRSLQPERVEPIDLVLLVKGARIVGHSRIAKQ